MKITEILERLHVPYVTSGHEHCRSGWTQVDCPYCAQTKHWRMGFKLDDGRANCWACGGKNSAAALSLLSGQPYHVCKELLGGLDRIITPERPRGKLLLPAGIGPLLSCHRSYLKKRRFDPDEIADVWGVQGIGLASKLSWRLFVPIRLRADVVSWTTRAISDGEGVTRYVGARDWEEAIPKRELLYGEHLCGHAVIVCEGPADVWRIGPGAVATLGAAFSRAQVLRLTKFPVRVVVMDTDREGIRAGLRLCRLLEGFPGETYRVVLSGKDPDSSPMSEILELRKLLR